jgi:Domain of unknown function (DUF6398)
VCLRLEWTGGDVGFTRSGVRSITLAMPAGGCSEARCGTGFRWSPIVELVSAQPPSLRHRPGPGERAAALAASYCSRRLGRAYAQAAWQILADAARAGVIRHGRPEAWAAGATVALVRANGLLGAGGALTAREVADELDVTLGALAVTERELSRVLNLARYARRLPAARGRTD